MSRPQCKDIPDEMFLGAVVRCQRPWGVSTVWDVQSDLNRRMPFVVNDNLTRAKALKLIKSGVINGCACGCRGDLEVRCE